MQGRLRVLVWAIVGFGACGSEPDAQCVAGRVESCPCPNGQLGVQRCETSSRFGPCTCLARTPDSGQLDVAVSEEASDRESGVGASTGVGGTAGGEDSSGGEGASASADASGGTTDAGVSDASPDTGTGGRAGSGNDVDAGAGADGDSCIANAPCYTGPPGTLNVGVCHAGSQACSNGTFDSCIGQVVPGIDECATLISEGCSDPPLCFGPEMFFGNIAQDTLGDLVFAAAGSGDFGGGPLSGLSLVKLTAQRRHVFTKAIPGGVARAAVGPDRTIVIAGDVWGAADFGTGVTSNPQDEGPDTFLAKYSSDGNILWAKRFNETISYAGTPGPKPFVDSQGNIWLRAWAYDVSIAGIDFGGGKLRGSVLAKYGPSGTHLWSRNESGEVVLAPSGGAYIVGGSSSVSKVDPAGGASWTVNLGALVNGSPSALKGALDQDGNLIVAGTCSESFRFGGKDHCTEAYGGIFVVKLTPDGSYLSSSSFGVVGESWVGAILSIGGDLYVAGTYTGTLILSSGMVRVTPFVQKRSGFVVRFDSTTLTDEWAKSYDAFGAKWVELLGLVPGASVASTSSGEKLLAIGQLSGEATMSIDGRLIRAPGTTTLLFDVRE